MRAPRSVGAVPCYLLLLGPQVLGTRAALSDPALVGAGDRGGDRGGPGGAVLRELQDSRAFSAAGCKELRPMRLRC